jgi:hypothetical protein
MVYRRRCGCTSLADGGPGNDELRVSGQVRGGPDDDIVSGRWAYGDDGNDLVGTDGVAWGGEGDDQVSGWTGGVLHGDAGNDLLLRADEAHGGPGDDVFEVGGVPRVTGGHPCYYGGTG